MGMGNEFSTIYILNGILPMWLMAPWLFCLREKYHNRIVKRSGVLELAPLSPPVDRNKIIEGTSAHAKILQPRPSFAILLLRLPGHRRARKP